MILHTALLTAIWWWFWWWILFIIQNQELGDGQPGGSGGWWRACAPVDPAYYLVEMVFLVKDIQVVVLIHSVNLMRMATGGGGGAGGAGGDGAVNRFWTKCWNRWTLSIHSWWNRWSMVPVIHF